MSKQARCVKCKEFDDVEKMLIVECPSCKYRTIRHVKECGGRDGALRSIRGHFVYWFKRRDGEGNHVRAVAKISRIIAERVAAKILTDRPHVGRRPRAAARRRVSR